MSKFTIESWQESDVMKGKNTQASLRSAVIKKHYAGVLQGTSITHYSLCYLPNGSATFTGIEVFTGQYQAYEGSISLVHEGLFEHGEAKGTLSIIEGSSTEQLKTISGTAHFCAGEQKEHELHTHFSL